MYQLRNHVPKMTFFSAFWANSKESEYPKHNSVFFNEVSIKSYAAPFLKQLHKVCDTFDCDPHRFYYFHFHLAPNQIWTDSYEHRCIMPLYNCGKTLVWNQ